MIDLSRTQEVFKKYGIEVTYEITESSPAFFVMINGVVAVVLFDNDNGRLSTYFRRSLTPIIVALFVTSMNEKYTLVLKDYFEVDFKDKIVFAEEAEKVYIESMKLIDVSDKPEDSKLN